MKKLLIFLLLIFAVSCAKPFTKPPEESVKPEETVKEEAIKPEEMESEVVEEVVIPAEEEITESAISAEEKAKSIFRDVMFDYDKYDIRPDARPVLDSVAAFLNENNEINIVIEGHCDARGTNEYNLALGEKRAKAAKNYLVSRGVSPTRIIVITYGEEKQLCNEQNELCWQKNRRAHFVVVKSRFY
ncbi:MAG TPA: peptidoglycan-associated lipoprotein Pal [Nitrospirae bacterium]|nr:peptidoglycan-associated lipoprotein precursor [bacterium BMS3Abin06]HDH12973.1 peptidoglycan-associated lipoprotein Pal [Nitrospirota bacterium]HDZ02966.1 peptidoglycan-associated lipoprotein Pal [Nitrospirota bacterium]